MIDIYHTFTTVFGFGFLYKKFLPVKFKTYSFASSQFLLPNGYVSVQSLKLYMVY